MSLPVKTAVDDVEIVCFYLGRKPTGATVKEAKAVIDPKHLDGRKLTALRGWGFIEDSGEKMKLTARGRAFARGAKEEQMQILLQIVRSCAPYSAMVERAAHRGEESISSVDVGAHWHDHFSDDVGKADATLNDQAITFFNIAEGAGLGAITVGRRGNPTRFVWDRKALDSYDSAPAAPVDPTVVPEDQEGTPPEEAKPEAEHSTHKHSDSAKREGQAALGQSIFLAHGRNKAPLEQLQKILRQFNIPFKVAVEEPNLGRPIGIKVREVMHACNCAILIFTADECLYDKDGKEVWRPSENVGNELGACGLLYQDRIVIIKEDKIVFPTNYKELGYISFSAETGLEPKAMEVLKELIGFGIVRIST